MKVFQIVSSNPHSSYLQGEEGSQIETVSTYIELITSFTGDNASSQFALTVNLARRISIILVCSCSKLGLRTEYSTRRTLVLNSKLHLYFWDS
ncbi:hypothetical protein CEXT_241761 [Caerostris extrusa]|uniref:Uncharacterized protein n=1 Tax=Caerostris extrusa TaxID=172846 RepID=A0AAV4SM20_CAEEX|nr:hypothetical protein CEXT_241761 [Caerostris extrusa]